MMMCEEFLAAYVASEEKEQARNRQLADRLRYVESFLPGFAQENGYRFIGEAEYKKKRATAAMVGYLPVLSTVRRALTETQPTTEGNHG